MSITETEPTTEQPVDPNAVPGVPGASIPEPVEQSEPEVDDRGLPLEPGARVMEVMRRQAAAEAEAAEAQRITEHAERLRSVVLELRADGWRVEPPRGTPDPVAG